MASDHESEHLQTEESDKDLESSRFLAQDSKPAGPLRRLVQHRFFGLFIVCSLVFHAGFIWIVVFSDAPPPVPRPKADEISVELVNEEQAQKGGAGQNGDGGPLSKAGKTDAGAQQNQPPDGKEPKNEPAQQDTFKDKPLEKAPEPPAKPDAGSKTAETKPSETNASPQPKTDAPPQDQKTSLQKESGPKPSASSSQNRPADRQQPGPPAQVPPSQASQSPLPDDRPQTRSAPAPLPTFLYQQPGDRLSLAIPAPLPTNDAEADPISYKVVVFGMLERAKEYPQSARERHATGHAIVGFSVDNNGQPRNVEILRSSGEADLDAESLSLIGRAAPFPVPPAGAQREFAVDIGFGDE